MKLGSSDYFGALERTKKPMVLLAGGNDDQFYVDRYTALLHGRRRRRGWWESQRIPSRRYYRYERMMPRGAKGGIPSDLRDQIAHPLPLRTQA